MSEMTQAGSHKKTFKVVDEQNYLRSMLSKVTQDASSAKSLNKANQSNLSLADLINTTTSRPPLEKSAHKNRLKCDHPTSGLWEGRSPQMEEQISALGQKPVVFNRLEEVIDGIFSFTATRSARFFIARNSPNVLFAILNL